MKVYLAARYHRIDELTSYSNELQNMGHQVTSRWLQGSHQVPGSLNDQRWATIAEEDVEDVAAADTVVCFTEADRGGGGGRHVEFGMGLAWGKRMLVVGEVEHLFHTLPAVEVHRTWSDAFHSLAPH